MSLLDDLKTAKAETDGDVRRQCQLCLFVQAEQDDETKQWLASAAAGSIGRDKFVAILQKHNTGIGKRTVARHRQEGHQP